MVRLAKCVGAFLSMGVLMSVPVAGHAQNVIQELEFTVKTGNDDLRSGGLLFGQIVLENGSEQPRFRINLRDAQPVGLPDGSEQVFKIRLPQALAPALLAKSKFILTHDGEPRNFGEGYDNWDLQGFRISSPPVCKAGETVAESSGTSGWARFTGAETDHILTVPQSRPRAVFPKSLVLKITTGTDDRRSNADTKAFITLRGGKRLAAVAVTGSTGPLPWVSLPLPKGTLLSSVASVTITHNGAGGRNITESYDNWDVAKVVLAVPTECSRYVWSSVSGSPWKRFTGSDRSATLSLRLPLEAVVETPME